MSGLRQVALGILAALLSTAIILGSLSLALTEGSRSIALAPVFTATPPPFPSETLPAGAPTPALSPSPSPTPACPVPPGWVVIFIQPGDTLESLAQAYGTTAEELAEGNCLTAGVHLIAGYKFSVPGLPSTLTHTETAPVSETPTSEATLTNTPFTCNPPYGWVLYTVQRGDTLYGLSRLFGVTVNQLRAANCIYGTDHIEAGQRLWVPNVPTRTFTPTGTPRPTNTSAPSDTPGSETQTPEPSETATETPLPDTDTPTPTPTPTPVTPTSPVITLAPAATPTPLPASTPSPGPGEPTP